MKRILVTGATGFIGRNCLALLHDQGYEVHAVTSKKDIPLDIRQGYIWHYLDLMNLNQIDNVISSIRPTHLLHLAWTTEPGKYVTSIDNLRWVQSSIELLLAFVRFGGERLVAAGTCFEYDLTHGYMDEKRTPINSNNLYGTCKASLRSILDCFAKQNGISSAWGRIFYLYGPYENENRFIPYVINSLLGRRIAQCSHGEQIRDYLYVNDVARAFAALIDSNVSGEYNIGSGKPVKVKEILSIIEKHIGTEGMIKYGAINPPPDEPPVIVANNEKIRDSIDWEPLIDIHKGIEQTVYWWKERLKRGEITWTKE